MAAKVLPGLAMAAFTVLAIRWLNSPSYAAFSITWLTSIIASNLAVGWLRQAHLRFGAVREPTWLKHLEGSSALTLLSPPVLVLLASIGATHLGYASAFLALTYQTSKNSLVLARHQAQERPTETIAVEMVRSVVPLVVVLTYTVANLVPNLPGIHALAMISAGYSAAAVVHRPAAIVRGASAPASLKDAWTFGWPLSLWLAISLTTQYVDRIMLLGMADASLAGAYAAGYDVSVRGTTLVLGPLALAAQPAYMRLREKRSAEAGRILSRVLMVQLAAASTATVLTATLYDQISGILGLDSRVTGPLFILLLLSAAAWNIALVAHKPVEYALRTKLLLAAISASLLMNIVANLALIPPLGMWGAAWATAISTVLYFVVVVVASRRMRTRSGFAT